ncbi:LytR/AlgR family response regulator transcription factor [Luteirhabdus pelagi]|uniref:LytR/AlgR family response regulator transcription factor n=1 Tax=Luteirhabdus pelagi TaxID=2792783 RepID=UPI001F1FED7F|nr:LytTR family DNA-binding domain-containing protein [Luteirhabdus pelagi]
MIKAYLVDDEPKALAILSDKIRRVCPDIEIIGTTQNPKEAIEFLRESPPDLLFLDVAMPEINGFEVLQQLEKPDFEIIFATGYDEYAVQAIKHCAIGYLVKPIDNDELVDAVSKAKENISEKSALAKNKALIENLQVKRFRDKKIIIPSQEGLEFLEIGNILHFEGIDGYTKIHINDRKPLLSSQSIGHFVKMLHDQDFYQVHKSHLINLNHINSYLNEGYVTIKDTNIPVSRNRRSDFLTMLKNT